MREIYFLSSAYLEGRVDISLKEGDYESFISYERTDRNDRVSTWQIDVDRDELLEYLREQTLSELSVEIDATDGADQFEFYFTIEVVNLFTELTSQDE